MKNIKKVTIQSDFFGSYKNQTELFETVKAWVKENLIGKRIVLNADTKEIDVELSWQGLKNDLNEYHPPFDKKLISFAKLPQILENAKYLYCEDDKKNRRDVEKIYRFFSRVCIDEIEFDIIIIILKTSKTFLYDHILLQKK